MQRLLAVSEPSIIRYTVPSTFTTEQLPQRRKTFTGLIGTVCMLPLRAIINFCVALRVHPNTLTLIGVLINVGAAWALGFGRFKLAFVIMLVANIFDFIDGKVAHILGLQSEFGAFWDSTLDRFSDLALLTGLIFLYSKLGRSDYVMIAALALIFSIMTSYARARAESLVEKCKVGFMERPERIVLLMMARLPTGWPASCGWSWCCRSSRSPTGSTTRFSRSTGCRCRRRRASPASSTARSSGPTIARRFPTMSG
jgi:CDP-diacylglycerol---glycerol-3-phosphate 3-phosphatidyltransferase